MRKPAPQKKPIKTHCLYGHPKVSRGGYMTCITCEQAGYKRRQEKAIAEGLLRRPTPKGTSLSVKTGDKCPKGHDRIRRPSGTPECPTCRNERRMAMRKLQRTKTCSHVYQDGKFQGLLNEAGAMVCLTCLTDEANK